MSTDVYDDHEFTEDLADHAEAAAEDAAQDRIAYRLPAHSPSPEDIVIGPGNDGVWAPLTVTDRVHASRQGDAANPHRGDCTGTRCPVCDCCMHCPRDFSCRCPGCDDPQCECPSIQREGRAS